MNRFLGVVHWSLIRHKYILPTFTIIQIVLAIAMMFGLALLMDNVDETASIYLATGTIAVGIIAVGSSLCAQVVSESKHNGIFNYQRSLPIPRSYILIADTLIWGLAALPGIVVSFIVAVLRFDLSINITFGNMFTILLFLFATISVGFVIAYFLQPSAVSIVAQLVLITNLLFSPITFPASRLPEWIVSIYNVLPFVPGTNVIRALLFNVGNFYVRDLLTVAIWCVICLSLSLFALSRRS